MKDVFLILILLICVWTDIKYRKIYNLVIGPGFLLALLMALWSGGWLGLGQSLLGGLAGLLLLLIPFLMGGIGAGDVKLLAMVGAFNGPVFAFYAFLGTALAGGLMALLILIIKKEFSQVGSNLFYNLFAGFFSGFRSISINTESSLRMPYGLAIALGTFAAYWVR